ncbi:LysR family transcriptional regulator [Aquisphaera insulae]|uniref:LysR family transcriptional regulator n=1 Tax=Aquisphaera insulae TaxID=2712864 RepID=UPI0034E2BDDB
MNGGSPYHRVVQCSSRPCPGPRARCARHEEARIITGSISLASERTGLCQPSLSLQIPSREVEFQARPFQRRGPRIPLTAEGQDLDRLARPLVESIDAPPATFDASRHGLETGRLTIAAGESTILYLLSGTIKAYAAAHPGIEIRLRNVPGQDG